MNWKQLGALLGMVAAILLLWNTSVVYPLKILVVFFHELSHGLASILTGGKIVSIQLSHLEGGSCATSGGNMFIILSAGYLGSMLFGGVILVAAARTRYDRTISCMLGAAILVIGILYARPILGFGFLFCVAVGIAIFLAGRYVGENFNDFMLKVIGLTSCMYAAADIISDGIARNIPCSDANVLASNTGLPGWLWSAIWLLISVVSAFFFLKLASSGSSSRGNSGKNKRGKVSPNLTGG